MSALNSTRSNDRDVEDYYVVDSNSNTIGVPYNMLNHRIPQQSGSFLPPLSYTSHIKLGYDLENRMVGINKYDLTRHLYVVGIVGSGKTTAVKRLLTEASLHGISWTVIDWEGEYRELVYLTRASYFNSKNFKLNLFGYGSQEDWEYNVEVLLQTLKEEEYNFSPQMEYVLLKASMLCQFRRQGLNCLREKIKELALMLPDGKRTLQALHNRFAKIFSGGLSHILGDEDTLGTLFGKRTVIDISDIAKRSPTKARLLVGIIMGKLRYEILRLPITSNVRHLIVLEEAEQLIPSDNEYSRWRLPYIAGDLLRYRKRGVGIVIVAHSPSLISKRVTKVVGNFLIFRLNDGEDKLWVAKLLGESTRTNTSIVGHLGKGEALLFPASLPEPFYIKIVPPRPSKSHAMLLLDNLRKYPGLSQRERRMMLGLSGKQYREATKILEELKIVRKAKIYTGRPGKSPVILELVNQVPSGAHVYFVNELKRTVSEVCGRKIKYIKASNTGPDLVVVGDNILIGVEAETGTNISRAKYLRFLETVKYLFIICVYRNACRKAHRDTMGLKNVWVGNLYRFPSALARVCHKEYFEP